MKRSGAWPGSRDSQFLTEKKKPGLVSTLQKAELRVGIEQTEHFNTEGLIEHLYRSSF